MKENQSPESNLEKLNRLYDKYLPKFEISDFHNTLWQIMINGAYGNIKASFTPVYLIGHLHLGIANGPDGYSRSTSWFKDEITYDEASEICIELNKEIFNLTPDEAWTIYAKSTWVKPESRN